MMGVIFDIKRFAVHDGPGIRTTVFFKGCPLQCRWCHNPESIEMETEIAFYSERCIGCGNCVEACPNGAQLISDERRIFDRSKCRRCGECTKVCYSEALMVFGREVTVEEVMNEVEKDRLFYENSSGGATLSGGEPLLQPQFAKEILAQCKDRRLHTVLDTCGYCEWRVFESLLRYVDLVLYDVKMIDPQKHRRFTGVSNDVILANVSKLAEMGKKMILRLPIVPAHNDSMEDISQMIAFCQRLCGNGSVVGVDLLPYHKYAQSKYRAFGKPYSLDKLEPPTEEKIEAIKKAFEGKKIKVKVD